MKKLLLEHGCEQDDLWGASWFVDDQRVIALWRKAWPEAQKHQPQRILLSVQAKKWSDQILGYSGLLDK